MRRGRRDTGSVRAVLRAYVTQDEPSALPAVSRRRTTLLNLFFSYASMGLVLVQGIVLVPLYVAKVPLALYGAWLATGNVLTWLEMVDPGTGDVIRQRVARLYGANDRAAQTELARLKADHDDAITMLSANRDRQLAEAHQRAAAAEQARDDAVQRMRVLEAANGASGVCAFHLCWDTHWSALDFLYQLINVRPPARVRARPKKKQGLLRRPWRKRS